MAQFTSRLFVACLAFALLTTVDDPVYAAARRWVFEDIAGKTHDPFSENRTRAIVVVFITTDCPIANYYQPTLAKLAKDFKSQGIEFFLLHTDVDTDVKAAKKHAAEFKIAAPVVLDHNQQVAQRLRAKVTPEAFVIDRQGKTHYQGRIDDLYADFGKRRRTPKSHDLKNALQALVAGKKIKQPMTKAIGCYISYVDSR